MPILKLQHLLGLIPQSEGTSHPLKRKQNFPGTFWKNPKILEFPKCKPFNPIFNKHVRTITIEALCRYFSSFLLPLLGLASLGWGTPYNGQYGEAPPYMGRLHPPFSGFGYIKGQGLYKFRYMKGRKIFIRVLKKGLELKQIKQMQLMTVSF